MQFLLPYIALLIFTLTHSLAYHFGYEGGITHEERVGKRIAKKKQIDRELRIITRKRKPSLYNF